MAMYEISIKIVFVDCMFYNMDLKALLTSKGEDSYFSFKLNGFG